MHTIKITNENYTEVMPQIAKLMERYVGNLTKSHLSFNVHKHKRNEYGVEQIMMFSPRFQHLSMSYRFKTINYDGQWYKGYYRLRGVEICGFNFEVTSKITIENAQEVAREIAQASKLLAGLGAIQSTCEPLNTADSGWDEFPDEELAEDGRFVSFINKIN